VRSLSDDGGIELMTVEGQLHILRADPTIRISRALLELMREYPDPRYTLDGDLLKLHGVNRTVVYRIGEKTEDGKHYRAEWPD
jgi:hypothetical protein